MLPIGRVADGRLLAFNSSADGAVGNEQVAVVATDPATGLPVGAEAQLTTTGAVTAVVR